MRFLLVGLVGGSSGLDNDSIGLRSNGAAGTRGQTSGRPGYGRENTGPREVNVMAGAPIVPGYCRDWTIRRYDLDCAMAGKIGRSPKARGQRTSAIAGRTILQPTPTLQM